MKLFLDTSCETDWARAQWARLARLWHERGLLTLTDSMSDADAILLTLADPRRHGAPLHAEVAASEGARQHPGKFFVFDTQDVVSGLFPGIYASLRRAFFTPRRHATGCYLGSFNEFVAARETLELERAQWLFSFRGGETSTVRSRLFAHDFARADVRVARATSSFWADIGSSSHDDFKRHYVDELLASRFVLCPRGVGTSSFRLFETLQCGRVPVIISDAWVPSAHLPWDEFSLRVRERDIARLPEICEANLWRWDAMARAARTNWEAWFSPEGMARLITVSLADIRAARLLDERLYRLTWPLIRAAAGARGFAARLMGRLLLGRGR